MFLRWSLEDLLMDRMFGVEEATKLTEPSRKPSDASTVIMPTFQVRKLRDRFTQLAQDTQ